MTKFKELKKKKKKEKKNAKCLIFIYGKDINKRLQLQIWENVLLSHGS